MRFVQVGAGEKKDKITRINEGLRIGRRIVLLSTENGQATASNEEEVNRRTITQFG